MTPRPTRGAAEGTLLDSFRSVRAVVVGEAMLDTYVSGAVTRLCPDGPFPVVDATDESHALGGAANVAANLAALGATVSLVSVVGADSTGDTLQSLAAEAGIDASGVIRDRSRTSLWKQRVVGDGRVISRVDRGSTNAVDASSESMMVARLGELATRNDLLVVADYRYGVVGEGVLEYLRGHRGRYTTVVDSKDLLRLRRIRPKVVTSNYAEVVDVMAQRTQAGPDRVHHVERLGSDILRVLGADIAAVTVDADGVVVVAEQGSSHVAAVGSGKDPCGAGDTFTATLALSLVAGAAPTEAARLACAASGIVVDRPGTAVCSLADLRGDGLPPVCDDLETVVDVVAWHRSMGRTVVFTNGCFDVLHAGHVASLAEAAEHGDILVVGLNGDDSVRRLKGPGRPVNEFDDRAAVVAGLSTVDHVVGFEEDTPGRLLEALRPDVYCKGGDYRGRSIPEEALVESWGGRFQITSYLEDRSTTATVDKVRRAGAAAAT